MPNKKASNLLGDGERKAKKEKIFYKSQAQSSTIENEIPESAKLLNESTESVPKIEEKEKKTENLESKEKGSEIRTPIVTSNPVCLKIMEGNAYELVDKNSTELSKATLDIFEARQKKLEEQNRKKKELLAKVVSAR